MSAPPPMMPPVMVSSANQAPGYDWFQQLAASTSAQNQIVEQNHIAAEDEASRQRISYGDQDRKEKVGFANREAIERNGLENRSAIDRNGLANMTSTQHNAGGDRAATVTAATETRSQAWTDFKHHLLGQRDQILGIISDRNHTITTAKEESLRRQGEQYAMADKLNRSTEEVALRNAQNTWQIKNEETMAHEKLGRNFIKDAGALSLEEENRRYENQKDFSLLSLQASLYRGDDDRRRVNYRTDTDRRFAKGATAAALYAYATKADLERNEAQFKLAAANTKAALELLAAQNKAKLQVELAECCCEKITVINNTSIATNQLAYATDTNRVRDQVAAVGAEVLVYSVKSC